MSIFSRRESKPYDEASCPPPWGTPEPPAVDRSGIADAVDEDKTGNFMPLPGLRKAHLASSIGQISVVGGEVELPTLTHGKDLRHDFNPRTGELFVGDRPGAGRGRGIAVSSSYGNVVVSENGGVAISGNGVVVSGGRSVRVKNGKIWIDGKPYTPGQDQDSEPFDPHASDMRLILPKDYRADYLVRTTSGEIDMRRILAGILRSNTTSGNAQYGEITVDDLELNTTSGDLEVNKSIIYGDFVLHTTSGDARLSDAQIARSANVQSVSGDVKIHDSYAPIWHIKTISGDVRGQNVRGQVFPKTVSGSVKIR